MTATLAPDPSQLRGEAFSVTLSERQATVLRSLYLIRRATPAALAELDGATPGSLAALEALGLVRSRRAGGRDPFYFLTVQGYYALAAYIRSADPDFQRKETPMTDEATTATTDEAPAPADPSPLLPLFKTLLAAVKKHVKGTTEEKAAYVRVNAKDGRTVAYLSYPTKKAVRVEIPKVGQSGYDVIKVATEDELPKVLEAVTAFQTGAAELAAKKAAEKEAATVAA